jgi:hypothetical protein
MCFFLKKSKHAIPIAIICRRHSARAQNALDVIAFEIRYFSHYYK